MKSLKIMFFIFLILLIPYQNYPQAMLKNIVNIESGTKKDIVDKVYKSKNDYLDINIIIPQLNSLENKEAEKAINNKITKWTEDWINDVIQIADEYFKNSTAPLMSYQLYARYKLTNKDNIISFYIDYYQFTGGAHGITTRMSYNIDKNSGKEIELKDLFDSNYDYKSVINKEISRQIAKDPDRYFPGKDGFKGISDNQSYYIKNNIITIYFAPYEIAPYASGIPEFNIANKLFDNKLMYAKI